MPWSNQGDDGSGSGPWGGRGGSRGGGGGEPPNLEDILREGQDRFRSILPGGGGGLRSVLFAVLIAIALWMASGFYKVQPEEQGVVLRFGAWVRTTQPGLHYHLPSPIETVFTPGVTRVNRIEVGFRSPSQFSRGGSARQVPEEALMLTGDENIVDINFTIFWLIKDAGKFLFNIRNPEVTLKSVAESAMRDVIGQTPIAPLLTEGRQKVEQAAKSQMQKILDGYGAGVSITQVQLQKVDPPEQVIDAFRDVQRAKADQERLQNQAETYRNDIIPRARGKAAQITQDAEAYKQQVVAQAEGEANRFLAVLKEYTLAKDVTKRRLYLETLEQVMGQTNKIIIDQSGGSGVIPYLPLSELGKGRPAAARPAAAPRVNSSSTNGEDG